MAPAAFVSQKAVERIARQVALDGRYLVLMGISGILAAIALLTNSVPILIGAMIVAPAFAPLALVGFALVARDFKQALWGLWVAVAGLMLAVVLATLFTWLMNLMDILPADANLLNKPLLEERVHPGWYSVFAAIAAGIAGTIAMAEEKMDTLVGVVAALALVPAGAAAGIALLSRDPTRALGGLSLLGINLGLIIAANIVTLWIMRPDQDE